jgi:23S rRNA (cytidine1920-2'-O)/16S rRNA (cytidine1409-2'-O)-methyltransferase
MTGAGENKGLRRLDVALVERGMASSRSRARDMVRRGLVQVAGTTQAKAGFEIAPDTAICIAPGANEHVSRGALKLAAALTHLGFPVDGVTALDLGASTGGFTEMLLERGAARVYAVDVGHGQLHTRLAQDARVTSMERCDARTLDRARIPDPIDAIVADVSFISLSKALPAALALAADDAWLIALIKPQFEAGREAVGKGGIVRDPAARARAVAGVSEWVAAQPGWRVVEVIASPITGGSGNQEFLLGAVRGT